MKEIFKSDLTGKEYCPSDVVRVVNMKQTATYLLNGVEILDFYASRSFETGEPIMVAIFDKKQSQEAYKKWCNFELK